MKRRKVPRTLATTRAIAVAVGLFMTLPWLGPRNIAEFSVITAARAQPAALTKAQSDALDAYNKAVNDFKSILSAAARADRCEATAAELAGTGALSRAHRHDERLQGPHRRASGQNRQAQQIRHSAGLFRCRQRAADRRVRSALRHHAGAARQCAKLGHAVQRRRRLGNRHCARQGPRCGNAEVGGPHQPGHLLCRDQRQPEHRQCALE